MKIEKTANNNTSSPPKEILIIRNRLVETLSKKSPKKLYLLLKSIQIWESPTTDLDEWIEVLNSFDSILENIVEKKGNVTSFEHNLTLEIVRFTLLLFQNSKNISTYNSLEHLVSFLEFSSLDLVLASLLVFNEYLANTTSKFPQFLDLKSNFISLIMFFINGFWNSNPENGMDLINLCKYNLTDDMFKKARRVRFSFPIYNCNKQKNNIIENIPSQPPFLQCSPIKKSTSPSRKRTKNNINKNHSSSTKSRSSHLLDTLPYFKTVDIPDASELCNQFFSHSSLIAHIIKQYDIPQKYSINVSYFVRFATHCHDVNIRRQFIQIKLLAFKVALRIPILKQPIIRFLRDNPHTIEQMLNLIKYGGIQSSTTSPSIPIDMQIIVLQILKLGPLARNPMIEMGFCARGGFFPYLMRQSVSQIRDFSTQYASSPNDKNISSQLSNAVLFYKVFYSLIGEILVRHVGQYSLDPLEMLSYSLDILNTPSFIFPQLLVRCIGIVGKILVNYSRASQWFIENNGHLILFNRLRQFISLPRESILFVNNLFDDIIPVPRIRLQSFFSNLLRVLYLAIRQQNSFVKFPAVTDGSFFNVIFTLLKRSTNVKEESFHKNDVMIDELDEDALISRALVMSYESPEETGVNFYLGTDVFTCTCSLLSIVIQNNPSYLSSVISSGVASTLLSYITPSLFTNSSIFLTVPEILRCISLNNDGLDIVIKSQALETLLQQICSEELLSYDLRTMYFFRRYIDELFRHVPRLVPIGIKTFVEILQSLKDKLYSNNSQKSKDKIKSMVFYTTRLIDGLSKRFGEEFVKKGGLKPLIELGCVSHHHYTGSHSDAHNSPELSMVLVSCAVRDPSNVIKIICEEIIKVQNTILNSKSFKKFEFLLFDLHEKRRSINIIHKEIKMLEKLDWLLATFLSLSKKISSDIFSSIVSIPIIYTNFFAIDRQVTWHFYQDFLDMYPFSFSVSESESNKMKSLCEEYLFSVDEFLTHNSTLMQSFNKFVSNSKMISENGGINSICQSWISTMVDILLQQLSFHPPSIVSFTSLLSYLFHSIDYIQDALFSRFESININILIAFSKNGGLSFLLRILNWLLSDNDKDCPWKIENNDTKGDDSKTFKRQKINNSENIKIVLPINSIHSPGLICKDKSKLLIHITKFFSQIACSHSLTAVNISTILSFFISFFLQKDPFNFSTEKLSTFSCHFLSCICNIIIFYFNKKYCIYGQKSKTNYPQIPLSSRAQNRSQLMNMGFNAQKVEQALRKFKNVDKALDWLIQNSGKDISDFDSIFSSVFFENDSKENSKSYFNNIMQNIEADPIENVFLPFLKHLIIQMRNITINYHPSNNNDNVEYSQSSIVHLIPCSSNSKSNFFSFLKNQNQNMFCPHFPNSTPDDTTTFLSSIAKLCFSILQYPKVGDLQVIRHRIISILIKYIKDEIKHSKASYVNHSSIHGMIYLYYLLCKEDVSFRIEFLKLGGFDILISNFKNFISLHKSLSTEQNIIFFEKICTVSLTFEYILEISEISNILNSEESDESLKSNNNLSSNNLYLSISQIKSLFYFSIEILKIQNDFSDKSLPTKPKLQISLLQIISKLTQRYDFGLESILDLKIPQMVSQLYLSNLENVINNILLHIMENPSQLQYRMEKEIFTSLSQHHDDIHVDIFPVSELTKIFYPFISRSPNVFIKALHNCSKMNNSGIRWIKDENNIQMKIIPQELNYQANNYIPTLEVYGSSSESIISSLSIIFSYIVKNWNEKIISKISNNNTDCPKNNTENKEEKQDNIDNICSTLFLLKFLREIIPLYPTTVDALLHKIDHGSFVPYLIENILCYLPWKRHSPMPLPIEIPNMLTSSMFDTKYPRVAALVLATFCSNSDIASRKIINEIKYHLTNILHENSNYNNISNNILYNNVDNGMYTHFVVLCELIDLILSILRVKRRPIGMILVSSEIAIFPILASVLDWLDLNAHHATRVVSSVLKVMELLARLDTASPLRLSKNEEDSKITTQNIDQQKNSTINEEKNSETHDFSHENSESEDISSGDDENENEEDEEEIIDHVDGDGVLQSHSNYDEDGDDNTMVSYIGGHLNRNNIDDEEDINDMDIEVDNDDHDIVQLEHDVENIGREDEEHAIDDEYDYNEIANIRETSSDVPLVDMDNDDNEDQIDDDEEDDEVIVELSYGDGDEDDEIVLDIGEENGDVIHPDNNAFFDLEGVGFFQDSDDDIVPNSSGYNNIDIQENDEIFENNENEIPMALQRYINNNPSTISSYSNVIPNSHSNNRNIDLTISNNQTLNIPFPLPFIPYEERKISPASEQGIFQINENSPIVSFDRSLNPLPPIEINIQLNNTINRPDNSLTHIATVPRDRDVILRDSAQNAIFVRSNNPPDISPISPISYFSVNYHPNNPILNSNARNNIESQIFELGKTLAYDDQTQIISPNEPSNLPDVEKKKEIIEEKIETTTQTNHSSIQEVVENYDDIKNDENEISYDHDFSRDLDDIFSSRNQEILSSFPAELLAEAVANRQTEEIDNSFYRFPVSQHRNHHHRAHRHSHSHHANRTHTFGNRKEKPLLPSSLLTAILKPLYLANMNDFQMFYRLIFHLCTYSETKHKLLELLIAIIIPENQENTNILHRPKTMLSKLPAYLLGPDSIDNIINTHMSESKLTSTNSENKNTNPSSTFNSLNAYNTSLPPLVFSRILSLLTYLFQRKPTLLIDLFFPKEKDSNKYLIQLFSLFSCNNINTNSEHIVFLIRLLNQIVVSYKKVVSLDDSYASTFPKIPICYIQSLISSICNQKTQAKLFETSIPIIRQVCNNNDQKQIVFNFLYSSIQSDCSSLEKSLQMEEFSSSFFQCNLSDKISTLQIHLWRTLRLHFSIFNNNPSDPYYKDNENISLLFSHCDFSKLWETLDSALYKCSTNLSNLNEITRSHAFIHKSTTSHSNPLDNEDDDNDTLASFAIELLPIIESYFYINAPSMSELITRDGENKTVNLLNSNIITKYQTFFDFAQRHQHIINSLCRKTPSLMTSSFNSLLYHPKKILSFYNKQVFFNTKLKQLFSESRHTRFSSVSLYLRRDHIFEDSYHQLKLQKVSSLRGKLIVNFIGEEGVDAGGLTRDWYISLSRQIFNPNYALFTASVGNSAVFQPNKFSYYNPEHLEFFRFVGRFVGKAIYDGYLLDAYFTRSFYKHVLGITPTYRDFESIDPSFYNSLVWMLNNHIDSDLIELTFSAETDEFGKTIIIDLIENGRNIPVTDENKEQYVKLITELRMTKEISSQIDSFLEGFHELIPQELIRIFNESELELLMCGLPEIDVIDWRNHSEYHNYTHASPVIQWFWSIVIDEMTQEERARLVQFVTGTSKVPITGFKDLQGMDGRQKFQIHRAAKDDNLLPSAHTCMNQLDLPEYSSLGILREKLLLAISEGCSGFHFR